MWNFLKHAARIAIDRPFRASHRYVLPAALETVSTPRQYYLVTATIVRNEAPFIREFVAFHKLVGVDHMIVYLDDGDDAPTRSALEDFCAEGFVELIPWPRFISQRNNQFLAYQHAVSYMLHQCTWLSFIDADEFLHAPSSQNLKAELQARENFDAIAVYSRTYGTSGIAKLAPGELLVEKLVMRGEDSHIKNRTQRSIVKPGSVVAIRSANTCVLRNTHYLGWDEAGNPVTATGEAGHACNFLRINHYFTRTEEDFRQKLKRRYFGKGGHQRKMATKHDEAADGTLSVVADSNLKSYMRELRAAVFRK